MWPSQLQPQIRHLKRLIFNYDLCRESSDGVSAQELAYSVVSYTFEHFNRIEQNISPLPLLGLRFFLRGDLLKRESYLINFSQQVSFSGLNSK